MPPRQDSHASQRDGGDITIEEIVFSCGICQKLVSDVYATKESDHGFNSSDHDESGVVTKFWMADCSHTFCGKHLEGGGAPFHQQGQQPSAPCPVCLAISPRRTLLRELFSIRGLKPGEYANDIPESYLICPPAALSGSDPEMDPMRVRLPGLDALRPLLMSHKFQYSQIIRYSIAVTASWRSEQRKRRILESNFSKERKQWRKDGTELKDRIAALEKAEAKLKKWEQRREMINHYLGLVGKMGEDINRMRSQLAQVGLHVPDGHYAFEPSKSDAAHPPQEQTHSQSKSRGDSAATLVDDQHHRSSSSRKRRHSIHEEYANDKENQEQRVPQINRRDSRELMPPPLPRPRQPQQQHPQKLPSGRPAEGRPGASARNSHAAARDVIQIYNNGGWNDSQSTLPVSEHDYAPSGLPTQQRARQDLGPLPFRPSQRPTPVPQHAVRQERVEPYYVDDVDARYQVPASSAPVPTHGLLSQSPGQLDQRQPYPRIEQHDAYARPPVSQARQGAQSRISYFDADYGTLAQQSGEHAPREMEGFRPASTRPRPFAPFIRPKDPPTQQLDTRPQRNNLEPSVASVASPFFKSGAAARPDTQQRPPARGTMAPSPVPRRTDIPRSSIGGYSVPPSRSSVAPPRNNLYSSQGHYPPPVSSQRKSSIAPPSFRAHSAASRYQPATQPTYRRAEVPPSPAGSHAPNRSVSLAQRNQMELPPRQPPSSSSRVPLGSSFDPQPSQIRGGRGANVSQMTYSRQGLSLSQPPPRSTYSATAGRRSVLR